MKSAIAVLIEKLHRHIFDNYYVQGYHITLKDTVIISLYDAVVKRFPNWRYELHQLRILRYSDYNRNEIENHEN